ncbi:MAG: PhzF family phenazine biosynthesis protein [Granulosicoccaceae bacterium]
MARRRYVQCDVFSPVPTQGNALAVVVNAEGLSDETMQRFAAWTNLAETTFLFPPDNPANDYKVRIMTPTREMLFAGHPTLGSCAAWLQSGGVPKTKGVVRQECGVGVVKVHYGATNAFAFEAPPTEIRAMDVELRASILGALGISENQVLRGVQLNNGPVWQAFELASAQDVLAVDSSLVRWPMFKAIGLIGAHNVGAEADFEVRMLAPSSGMSEDPITGSLNSALAHWLQQQGRLEGALSIAQGTAINRCGRVSVGCDGSNVRIGGDVHLLIEGEVNL